MNENRYQQIEDTLAAQHACYVLITCKRPNKDGRMNVEMRYGGDVTLASLLIEGAKDMMDDDFDGDMLLPQ